MIWRVERRATFEVLRRERRAREGPITVSYAPGNSHEPPRVAYTVPRRAGTAVTRNRLRRRLRTLMREAAPTLPRGAYLISTAPSAATASYGDLAAALGAALARLDRQEPG